MNEKNARPQTTETSAPDKRNSSTDTDPAADPLIGWYSLATRARHELERRAKRRKGGAR